MLTRQSRTPASFGSPWSPSLSSIRSGYDLASLSGEAPAEGHDTPSTSLQPDSARSFVSSDASTVSGSDPGLPGPWRSSFNAINQDLGFPSRKRSFGDEAYAEASPIINSFESYPNRSFERGTSSCNSVASSFNLYGEPEQTLIFLDWDDTLFPTTELFDRRRLPLTGDVNLDEDLNRELEPWRQALKQFLIEVRRVSDLCVIVTNSKRPWVDQCIKRFFPELQEFIEPKAPEPDASTLSSKLLKDLKDLSGKLSKHHYFRVAPYTKHHSFGSDPNFARSSSMPPRSAKMEVVYANEVQDASASKPSRISSTSSCICAAFGGIWQFLKDAYEDVDGEEERKSPQQQNEEKAREYTLAKRTAMERKAELFYSRYHGQTWKNVLSFGDMHYEHDAVKELPARRQEQRQRIKEQKPLSLGRPRVERLRAKAIVVPGQPTLAGLTLQLQVTRRLLDVFVHHDGALDVDLGSKSDTVEPMAAVAEAVKMPQLATVSLPAHMWNHGSASDNQAEVAASTATELNAMDQIEMIVHEHMQAMSESSKSRNPSM